MHEKWFWRLYRLARVQRAYTRQPEAAVFENVIRCTSEELELVSSTNIIFHVKTRSENGYFMPIYRHQDMRTYLQTVVNDYYMLLYPDCEAAQAEKAVILKCFQEPQNVDRFLQMGRSSTPGSPLSQYLDSGNPKLLGLEGFPRNESAKKRLFTFISKYYNGARHAYLQNSQVGNGRWQTAATNRTMAVEKLADSLGLFRMIPHTEYCVLEVGGHHCCFGQFMARAEGADITKITPQQRNELLTPALQRDLNRLNLLDTLVCEVDHCPENYNLVIQDGQAKGICVFDNNAERNFSILWNVSFETIIKCSPYIDAKGYVNRPYVDGKLADRVSQITFGEVYRALKSHLALLPIISLFVRIKRVDKAIRKSVAAGTVQSISADAWSEKTLETEQQWSHGKTYLHSFLKDCVHI